MIGIIDYKAGNLTSVARALQYLGEPWTVTADPRELSGCDRIIFPGVGAAGEAMANLRRLGMDAWLRTYIASGKPLLGICLGTQVIISHSEENDTPCLDLVPGRVRRFPGGLREGGRALKIPHMGWNRVEFSRPHPVFAGLPAAEYYFVHSFYPDPADTAHILGRTEYGLRFCSALANRNLVAVQFHPEKSGAPGLRILANFCRWGGAGAQ